MPGEPAQALEFGQRALTPLGLGVRGELQPRGAEPLRHHESWLLLPDTLADASAAFL